VIPAAFEYRRAESLTHALELLGESDDAVLLAGGHSLVPLLKLRLAHPELLVDIGRLHELSYVRAEDGGIAIGALTRHHDVARSELLRQRCPLLAETAALVGDPQVRHRGTIGGSVAHGDPASDLPATLVACDARFVLAGAHGERVVAATDFFRSFLTTAKEPGEVLTEIRVPETPAGAGSCYLKFSRRAQDWATVGVAVLCATEGDRITSAAIALTNMGATPVRAREAERQLAGAESSPERIEAAALAAIEGTQPPSDTAGSADYRRHLATVLTRRALERVLDKGAARPDEG
jgi:carbon-monoxide dehydrogenase medium subunit